MLQNIEDINLLKLMKDIKYMISEGKTEFSNEDYKIILSKNTNVNNLTPIVNLLDLVVQEYYLVPEVYFESKDEFERCFSIKYDDSLYEIFNSIRIEEIKVQSEDTYNGTFIYHEVYGGKLKFELACIKYLSKFQRQILWGLD